jgi:hypothetical protein
MYQLMPVGLDGMVKQKGASTTTTVQKVVAQFDTTTKKRVDKAAQEGNALLYIRLSLTDLSTSARRAGKKRKICSSQGSACVVHNDR